MYLDDVETEIQILSEYPGLDALAQVAIGRGDESNIRSTSHAINTDGLKLSGLSEPQEHRLHSEAHLAEFIEEKCPSVGLSDQARLVSVRAGETASRVSEEL